MNSFDKDIDRIYRELEKLDREKRNKSECELVKNSCTDSLNSINENIKELKSLTEIIKEDNIKINAELENINERIAKIEDNKEKRKWFKIESIRRFILIIIGSLSAIFVPLIFNLLRSEIMELIKILLEGVI